MNVDDLPRPLRTDTRTWAVEFPKEASLHPQIPRGTATDPWALVDQTKVWLATLNGTPTARHEFLRLLGWTSYRMEDERYLHHGRNLFTSAMWHGFDIPMLRNAEPKGTLNRLRVAAVEPPSLQGITTEQHHAKEALQMQFQLEAVLQPCRCYRTDVIEMLAHAEKRTLFLQMQINPTVVTTWHRR